MPAFWITDSKGRHHARIRPLHYRLRAQHGDAEAIAICRERGWLWQQDDGKWREFEARYIAEQRGYVPADAPPLSPNTPVPGSRALNQRSFLPYKDD